MGYRLNRLIEPVFIALPKLLLTEFGIHYRLESCESCFKGVVIILACDVEVVVDSGEYVVVVAYKVVRALQTKGIQGDVLAF